MTDATVATTTQVTVRCFAASRAALGFSERAIAVAAPDGAATVGDVVAVLAAETPAAEPVLARCSLLLDGRRVEASQAVPDGATLDLLPPFAGG